MVIQLMLFLFVPVRVALAAPVALFGAFGATLSIWATTTLDASVKVGTAFLVALPAVLGYAAALRQQTERQEFLLRRQLQDANRELQDEVARRVALQDELNWSATPPRTCSPSCPTAVRACKSALRRNRGACAAPQRSTVAGHV